MQNGEITRLNALLAESIKAHTEMSTEVRNMSMALNRYRRRLSIERSHERIDAGMVSDSFVESDVEEEEKPAQTIPIHRSVQCEKQDVQPHAVVQEVQASVVVGEPPIAPSQVNAEQQQQQQTSLPETPKAVQTDDIHSSQISSQARCRRHPSKTVAKRSYLQTAPGLRMHCVTPRINLSRSPPGAPVKQRPPHSKECSLVLSDEFFQFEHEF